MNNKNLPGDYIAGFVDGEGCFVLKYRRDQKRNKINNKVRTYFYWGIDFVITLRGDDAGILRLIQGTIGCGNISNTKMGDQVRFSVQDTSKAKEIIVPFFNKFKLRAKKRNDFIIWCKAVEILYKYRDGKPNSLKGTKGFIKKQINNEDQKKLQSLRLKMLKYKANRPNPYRWAI